MEERENGDWMRMEKWVDAQIQEQGRGDLRKKILLRNRMRL